MHRSQNPETEPRIREGFPKQRLVVLPSNAILRAQNLPLVNNLHVTDIGGYPTTQGHYVERTRGSNQAILIYCLSGKGILRMDESVHKIQTGHVIIIPPNAAHVYQSDPVEPWSILWIHFDGHQVDEVLQSLDCNSSNPLLYVPDTHLMRNAFEEVYACLNYQFSDAGLLAMSSEFMRLISKIQLHKSHQHSQIQTIEKRVLGTRAFMEQHLDMTLSLTELAARSGQSVPYYSKLFKQRTNQSPMAYFIQLKIGKACELLDQTELSIQEVARRLGYDDPYYFSRLFKKVQGCAPTAYRSSIKG